MSTAARKITTTTKPFDVDTLERTDDPGTFSVTLGGREFVLVDPQGAAWGDVMGDEQPSHPIYTAVLPADREAFAEAFNALPIWKTDIVTRAYNERFGVDDGPRTQSDA